jgi:hypothetical protein
MDGVWQTISFGVGRRDAEKVDHPLFESPAWKCPEVCSTFGFTLPFRIGKPPRTTQCWRRGRRPHWATRRRGTSL